MIMNKTIAAAAAILVSVLSGVAVAQTAAPAPAATTAPTAAPAPATKEADPATVKFRAACKADIDTLCGAEIAAAKAAAASAPAATEPAKGQGGGRVMGACMTANEAKLSADCKTAWTERKAAWAAKKG
jgi:hypothetical protein